VADAARPAVLCLLISRGSAPRLFFDISMMGFFRRESVPPPPPPPEESATFIVAVLALAGVTTLLCFIAGIYMRRRWAGWIDAALDHTFSKCDKDGSGKVTKDEFHIAILEMYLQLHQYGLNVRAPQRAFILNLMKEADFDGDDEISREEFRKVVTRMLASQTSRIATQLGLTVLCPVTASHVAALIRYAALSSMALVNASPTVPAALAGAVESLPPTLDETIVCSAMMASVGPALAFVDSLFETSMTASKKSA
jgi:hypothetical protein